MADNYDDLNIYPARADASPKPVGSRYNQQESTMRVDGMASAETLFKKGATALSNYAPGQFVGGHYEIIELIGRGGMSLVYRARHALIDQERAIKVLLTQNDPDGRGLKRFQLEAKLAMPLEHPNIVRVLEFASPFDGPPYMVMDFVEGRSLEQELAIFKRLSATRACRILEQIIDALIYVHANGIIHRDLKPANLILVKERDNRGNERVSEKIKLIDFGIAKKLIDDYDDSRVVTPSGEIVGSPQHMSPEQCAGTDMDERSEIYSLGCILYELLSGKPPILGKNALDTLRLQASIEPRPLATLVESKDAKALSPIVHKCLAKDPEDRYQSLAEFKAALQAAIRPRSKLPLMLSAGLLTLAISVGAAYFAGYATNKVSDDKQSQTETTGARDYLAMLTQSGDGKKMEPSPGIRLDDANKLARDLDRADHLGRDLLSRVLRLAQQDRESVPLPLQRRIFDRAMTLSTQKKCAARPGELATLKTLQVLANAQMGQPQTTVPHAYMWNTYLAASKQDKDDLTRAWPLFYCGDYYDNLGNEYAAKESYEHAEDTFDKHHGDTDWRSVTAHALQYHVQLTAHDIKEKPERGKSTLEALDDLIARGDHATLALSARARLLARLALIKPAIAQEAENVLKEGIEQSRKNNDESLSLAHQLEALDTVQVKALSKERDKALLAQALQIHLAYDNLAAAARVAVELSHSFLSPDKIDTRMRLLETARGLYQKLQNAALDVLEPQRNCLIEIASLKSDKASGSLFDPKGALKCLDDATANEKIILSNAAQNDEDKEFRAHMEKWTQAKMDYLAGLAHLRLLDPRQAKAKLTTAAAEIKENLEFIEQQANTNGVTKDFIQDKKDRLALKSKIEDLLREANN